MLIFVGSVKFTLIFDQIFNVKQNNNEYYKENTYPLDTVVAFGMEFFVFCIGVRDGNCKNNKENNCKNDLSVAEHIAYFYAKLT
jgi:hypothetical protein